MIRFKIILNSSLSDEIVQNETFRRMLILRYLRVFNNFATGQRCDTYERSMDKAVDRAMNRAMDRTMSRVDKAMGRAVGLQARRRAMMR